MLPFHWNEGALAGVLLNPNSCQDAMQPRFSRCLASSQGAHVVVPTMLGVCRAEQAALLSLHPHFVLFTLQCLPGLAFCPLFVITDVTNAVVAAAFVAPTV